MAEIQQTETNRKTKRGVRRSKKLSTRVDLTPMVDLGFLLITFFVFTSTLATPRAMGLVLPEDKNIIDSIPIPESKTITAVLAGNNIMYCYYGTNISQMQATDYSPAGFRSILINKKNQLRKAYGTDSSMVVVIKPTENCSYKNVIDALDEMAINNVKIYFLVDADETEKTIIAAKK